MVYRKGDKRIYCFDLRERPEPLFLPPPVILFSVAQARRIASLSGNPFFHSFSGYGPPGVFACWYRTIYHRVAWQTPSRSSL
jgi:hypothetical protein